MSAQAYLTLYWSYTILLVSCSAYGLAKGGSPERLAVGIMLVARIATAVIPKTQWAHLDTNILIVDTLMFLSVVVLALKAQRFWPMWWAALKLDMLVVHFMSISSLFMPWSYAAVNTVLSFASPVIIAVGTWRHQNRVAKYGSDPAWSVWTEVRDGALVVDRGRSGGN